MEQAHIDRIEELVEYCPEGCKCHKRTFADLCKARDIGLDTFVECMEDSPSECTESISYGDISFCSCPPRVYIVKIFGK